MNRIITNGMTDSDLKRMMTTLKNLGIQFSEGDVEHIQNEYSHVCSERTKRAYGKWLASNLMRKETFSERSSRGLRNRGRRLASDRELTDDEALVFGKLSLGGEAHGQAIKFGLLKKHGSDDAVSASYKHRALKSVAKALGIAVDALTRDEIRAYYKAIGFFNNDVHAWKRKQAEKHTGEPVDDNDVNRVYSEYLSERFKQAQLEVVTNGYLKSKKGWYEFTSHPNALFYRSSWELKVFEVLDELCGSGRVTAIRAPTRIQYVFEGRTRHYYPDVAWTTEHGDWVGEVKPYEKLNDPLVVAKSSAARDALGDAFVVITENELMNLKEFLHV